MDEKKFAIKETVSAEEVKMLRKKLYTDTYDPTQRTAGSYMVHV